DVQARFRVLDAVAAFLRRATRQMPLLVVLEDLHWADEASLTLLAFVVRELRGARLLLVPTCPEDEPRPAPRALTHPPPPPRPERSRTRGRGGGASGFAASAGRRSRPSSRESRPPPRRRPWSRGCTT